jgi:hypothetical protein
VVEEMALEQFFVQTIWFSVFSSVKICVLKLHSRLFVFEEEACEVLARKVLS